MSGWFQFGQLDSTDYDLLIFEKAVDRAPMWGQSAQEVPGRNGELLIPTQRMPNVERRHPRNSPVFRQFRLVFHNWHRLNKEKYLFL